jgi:glycosyltransferase involved in cell wall biosynthesis
MDTLPKVSILVPVYNRQNIIRETLDSAVNQTYENIEVVVVDNKSTDDTYQILLEYAAKHPCIRVYQNQENLGPARNWQKCVERATGEYVKILWSDDLIAPTFVEKSLPYLVDYKDVGFVFTGTELFDDETGKRKKQFFIGDTGLYDTKKFMEGCLLDGPFPHSPGNALFRKKDFEKNLLIDVPNKIGSDFKMHTLGTDALIYLLTAKDYPKFAFVGETLSFYRLHADSITISSNRFDRAILYDIAKAYFVENYLNDDKLKQKFNLKLFVICLMIKKRNTLGVKSLEDFYFKQVKVHLSDVFFAWPILKRLIAKAWGKYGLETYYDRLMAVFHKGV